MRDDSKSLGLPRCVIAERLLGKLVEPPGANVTLQLTVLRRPVELQKPRAKLRKLLGREGLHLPLETLDVTHDLLRSTRLSLALRTRPLVPAMGP